MRAWRVHEHGEPADTFVLDEIPEPTADDLAGLGMHMSGWVPAGPGIEPFTDWVIMRMSVAALALPDVTMCRGTYPVPVAMPYVSGQEGVGVVVDAAPARRSLIGTRVAAVTIQPFGSLAPVAVGISTIFSVPDSMSDEDAAGFVIPAHTAFHAVHRRGNVQAGEVVGVLGAAGGLGSAIVQLCVAAGAQVVAIVGDAEKARICEELGAQAVDHSKGDFVEGVPRRRVAAGSTSSSIRCKARWVRGRARCSCPTDATCCAAMPGGWFRTTRTSTWRTTHSSARPSVGTRGRRCSACTPRRTPPSTRSWNRATTGRW